MSSTEVGEHDPATIDDALPEEDRARPEEAGRLLDRRERRLLLAFFLGLAALFGLVSGGHAYSIDDELMYEGTWNLVHLDPHLPRVFPNPESYSVNDNGKAASVFGFGQSIIGVPLYVAGKVLGALGSGPGADFAVRATTFMTNAIVMAAVAAVVALLCRELGASVRGSYLLAISYVFGTYALAIVKTFGSEPGAALCTIAGCYFAIRFRRTGRVMDAAVAGVVIGLAPMFRISTGLFVPVVGLYVVFISLRSGARRIAAAGGAFAVGALASLVLLALSNWWRYGSPTEVGYATASDGYPVVRGLVDLYFSPGKSFFMFAPVTVVILVACLVNVRRWSAETGLLLAIVLVNSVTIARLTIWSGDYTWGPRYLQVTLPVFVCLGAMVVDKLNWRRLVKVTSLIGFALPALLALLINFNVFLLKASSELTGGPVASEFGQRESVVALRHTLAWNQILGHAELLPQAVRDVVGARRETDSRRWTYEPNPLGHFGYFAAAPRIDFWWLWVAPTGASGVTYLLFVPIAVTGGVAFGLWRRNRSVLGPPRHDFRRGGAE